ncbi:MAG TPA: VTT domain-containing protein [Vicinamibacterales bacterium]
MTAAKRREYVGLAAIGAVLVAATYFARAHADPLKHFIDRHAFWGVFLYVTLNILDALLLPGATLPLIPVAVRAWGRVPAALVTTAGWTAGSLLAFLIARRWGSPIVRKLTSMERLRRMRRYIPQDLFVSIALLRLVMPMDVISYVLGLFTDISWSKYVAATALGLTPPAFVLAYLGKLPRAYDLIAIGVGVVVAIGWIMAVRRRGSRSR